MINKKQIAELAKRIVRTEKGLTDPQIMHPQREWSLGLLVALAIFTSCSVWSAYVYMQNENVTYQDASSDTSGTVVYRESLVKSALQEFRDREAVLQELRGAVPSPVIEEVSLEATTTDIVASSTEESATEEMVTSE